ncbi:XTP/dITP diphosphatase [Desulfofundulus thermosubterraneus]|uniref:dITP/XTP pyrophosphatase n=1 Tax=Desulfofundulus thermosubterraneus DSM 16057 TaxID=1121432 RepID=A0A1M6IZW6_9FIRM|nr:XTP/dITP diphosphatase [Desulfofundulus thermosubterraneus]SHJ39940.1 XTP/dITP diphosphohydrolase [Desulfofundulus thermosubterraneus DSM 16057]
MKLVLATRNPGKVRELSQLLSPLGYEVVSLEQYPGMPEITEDGATFKDNAVKKATAVARYTGQMALADDSGLEVDYLGGAPGVHSARFAGAGHDDRANNEKLLRLLAGVPPEKRTARFRCVVAVATPEGRVFTAEGICEGVIADKPRGEGGFGYDPLFYVPSYGKTFAELDPAVKNRISHRGRALVLMREILAGLRRELDAG